MIGQRPPVLRCPNRTATGRPLRPRRPVRPKVGNFASLNAGAGISGTSAFAGANVSVLGVPVVGVGKSLGQLGRISDPYAATLVGNFSDAVLHNTLPADGIGDWRRLAAIGATRRSGPPGDRGEWCHPPSVARFEASRYAQTTCD